ncbi:hypothetical protein GJ744_012281 [Endocarpon pusillum]|uniref:Uncharacterized protein n=1 Tax=Endocarpon pusillum TaxID=364733 RepID=A0A8H7E0F9_9EURO|nr:hypothetical protein GJ744_012281 [Endocarpon pusillum]
MIRREGEIAQLLGRLDDGGDKTRAATPAHDPSTLVPASSRRDCPARPQSTLPALFFCRGCPVRSPLHLTMYSGLLRSKTPRSVGRSRPCGRLSRLSRAADSTDAASDLGSLLRSSEVRSCSLSLREGVDNDD